MNSDKISHHISEQFNKELQDVRNKVLVMGGLVEHQLALAITAFTSGNVEIADQVIRRDSEVDVLEMTIDRECSEIIARRQPTAFDLRLLIAVIKIVREIERAGDKAVRIAQMAIRVSGVDGQYNHQYELEHMADLIKEMVHLSLDAFARLNIDEVTGITGRDANVNREYENILRRLITRMMEDPRNMARVLDVIWVARALERVGDYACNICEHLVYIVNGLDVRHLSHEEMQERIAGNSTDDVSRIRS